MIPVTPRPALTTEQSVIRRALETAATSDQAAQLAGQIGALRIVSKCECGCASVNFAAPSSQAKPRVVADALAKTHAGNTVGVLVWGTDRELTGLEVYSMSAPDDASLPTPDSLMRW